MVNTTGLVIVVSGLYGRDVEFRNPNDCSGDGVIEGPCEGVEEEGTELVELLSWGVVEGGVVEVVWDGSTEVEGDIVGVGWSVFVLGGWVWEKEGESLSAQISERT